MYSRNYDSTEDFTVPKNYDGTAFSAKAEDCAQDAPPRDAPSAGGESAEAFAKSSGGFFSSLFGKLPFAGALPQLGFPGQMKLPEIHGEELLIIAVALFLLFSKNGDKESAIILLILLFF